MGPGEEVTAAISGISASEAAAGEFSYFPMEAMAVFLGWLVVFSYKTELEKYRLLLFILLCMAVQKIIKVHVFLVFEDIYF